MPDVKSHDLDVPRIGYIHSWGNTQDEGWVRAALDYYKIPYTYFGENEVVKRDLKQFDVILWPHGGGVGAIRLTAQRTDRPSVSRRRGLPGDRRPDSTDDTRGGMGQSGFRKLYDWSSGGRHAHHRRRHGRDLPAELPDAGITSIRARTRGARIGVSRHRRGPTSPIVYGIPRNHIRSTTRTAPLFSVAVSRAAGGTRRRPARGADAAATTRTRSRWDRARTCSALGSDEGLDRFVPPAADANAAVRAEAPRWRCGGGRRRVAQAVAVRRRGGGGAGRR
jgi:hypothetical protein